MLTRFILFASAMIILTFTACKKENEENLINKQGGPAPCDTSDMKYTADIKPILVLRCYSCHGNGLEQIGVNFDTYANVKKQVDNNKLINVIKHTPGYTPMPFGLPKLSSCEIDKIQDWINNGARDN
ncbi:MAG: hypothetical protein ABJA71_11590 [Ginsengibacter sp.]